MIRKIKQIDGWSIGENKTSRKLTISLDDEVGEILNEKKKQTGISYGRIINSSLRKGF